MLPLRRTLWVAHAWLMVVLTLVSGLPHRQCVCPDGGVKWFCLDLQVDLVSLPGKLGLPLGQPRLRLGDGRSALRQPDGEVQPEADPVSSTGTS